MSKFSKILLGLGLTFSVFFSTQAHAKFLGLDRCATYIMSALGLVADTPKSQTTTVREPALKSLRKLYPSVNFSIQDPAEFIVSRHSKFFAPGGVARYEIQEVVFVSNHSIVVRALDLQNNREVAIKILNDGKPSGVIDYAINQAPASLIQVIEYSYNKKYRGKPAYLVSAWLTRPNFREELSNLTAGRNVSETKAQIKDYLEKMVQLANSLDELNKAGWLLTDGKPDNFGFDENGKLKIFDLDGLCAFVPGKGINLLQESPGMTKPYASPELVLLSDVDDPPKRIDYSWLPKGTLVPSSSFDSQMNVSALIGPKSDAYTFGKILEETVDALLKNTHNIAVRLKLENIKKTIVDPLLVHNPHVRNSIDQAIEPLKAVIQDFEVESKQSLVPHQ